MNVNWDNLVPGPGGVLIPTYGKYGGPGYSDGKVLDYPTQPVAYRSKPADALDALFERHDKAYDSLDPLTRAKGDLALLDGISKLPNGQLDPEASVYAGFATLLYMQQLTVVNGHPELLSQTAAIRYTHGALHDIERGLSKLDASDRAEFREWLEDTAIAVGGATTHEVLDLLNTVEFHGFQAHIGNLHLAGPRLAESVSETFALLFTDEAQTFDFKGVSHITQHSPPVSGGSLEELTGQVSLLASPERSQPEHGADSSGVEAGPPSLEHLNHFVPDYLL